MSEKKCPTSITLIRSPEGTSQKLHFDCAKRACNAFAEWTQEARCWDAVIAFWQPKDLEVAVGTNAVKEDLSSLSGFRRIRISNQSCIVSEYIWLLYQRLKYLSALCNAAELLYQDGADPTTFRNIWPTRNKNKTHSNKIRWNIRCCASRTTTANTSVYTFWRGALLARSCANFSWSCGKLRRRILVRTQIGIANRGQFLAYHIVYICGVLAPDFLTFVRYFISAHGHTYM